MQDELTELGNAKYLESKYYEYIGKYNNANFIMIDFSNFKKINDTYGHDVGDKCLKTFANKLKIFFKKSILIRLHGDEFAVVTYRTEEEIKKLLDLIDLNINVEVESGLLPLKFGFNAGSTKVSEDLVNTQAKADYMMYYAKKNKNKYQAYDSEIFQKKLNEQLFLDDFGKKINTEDFSYYGRNLYDINDEETKFIQVYTKDLEGHNILSGLSYATLRKNSQIAKFDMFNLQNLIGKICMIENDNRFIINIDYKSLLSIKGLVDFLEHIKVSTINGISNIILSIDVSGIESNEYPITIELINLLNKIGFSIRLDKLDNSIADSLLEETSPDYIKVSTNSWKSIINNRKKEELLKLKLKMYALMGNDTSIIFEQIETEEELKRLKDISPDNTTLYSGNYYSRERKLELY